MMLIKNLKKLIDNANYLNYKVIVKIQLFFKRHM